MNSLLNSIGIIIKTPKIWLMETMKGRKDKVLKVVVEGKYFGARIKLPRRGRGRKLSYLG